MCIYKHICNMISSMYTVYPIPHAINPVAMYPSSAARLTLSTP